MRLDPEMIRQQIMNLLVQYPELADDEVLRADCIEAETDAMEFLRVVERRRQEACALAGALATNIAEITERQGRFERREQAMRAIAFKIMQAAELRKVEIPEATLSIANGKQKLIGEVDAKTLPDSLVRISRDPDKKAIKAAL